MMNYSVKKTFYRRLGALLASGVAMSAAVERLADNAPDSLARVMPAFRRIVAAGGTLSDAMHEFCPGIFSVFEAGVVRAGEESGALPESLARLAEYFEFADSLRRQFIAGLTYPVILLHAAMIIPALPAFFLAGAGAFFARVLPALVLLYGVAAAGFFLYRRSMVSEALAAKRDRLILGLPYLGNLLYKLASISFLKSFLALYSAGLNVARAAELAAGTAESVIVRREIRELLPRLKKGERLSVVLSHKSWLPPVVCEMLATGEISGRMDAALERVLAYLQEEADFALGQVLKIFPIAVYLLAALYAGYLVIAFFMEYAGMLDSLAGYP